MRNPTLDILRLLAITMIVLMHSPLPDGNSPGWLLSGISYLTAPGIGLFFMVSGALLLRNKLSQKEFLKRRFSKILWPTLVWSVFYLALKYWSEPPTAAEATTEVLSIPLTAQGHGVLWFMYTLAGLYLLTPILSQWLQRAGKREVLFYLGLWAVTLTYPYLKFFGLKVNDSDTGILYYFSGYAGYYLLGFWLSEYVRLSRMKWLIVTALSCAAVVSAPAGLLLSGREFDFYQLLWYLSLPVALMALLWWLLLHRFNIKSLPDWVTRLSQLSFGVYLIHIFVMRWLLWPLPWVQALSGPVEIVVVTIGTMTISWAVVWCVSRLPVSKYIIGV